MAIEIISTGSSIKITTDGNPKYIIKARIISIDVLRDTIIKIDIGQGPLYNVFVDQTVVTTPASTDVNDLRDKIAAMLETAATAGTATEAKQNDQLTQLQAIQGLVNDVKTNTSSIGTTNALAEPKMEDQANSLCVYKGFAAPGAAVNAPVWAIQRITNTFGVLSYQWAGGNKNFDKIWNNRATLMYS